jgi:SpoVK/Ycf46/Vps4 family AAA+-type ATPase
MDGLRGKHDSVTIIATTKDPKKLDEALLRPGRFDRHIALRNPQSMEETWNVLALFLSRIPHQPLDSLDQSTAMKMKMRINGMSPCDIENIIREAVMQQLRVDITSQQLDLRFIAKRLGAWFSC